MISTTEMNTFQAADDKPLTVKLGHSDKLRLQIQSMSMRLESVPETAAFPFQMYRRTENPRSAGKRPLSLLFFFLSSFSFYEFATLSEQIQCWR